MQLLIRICRETVVVSLDDSSRIIENVFVEGSKGCQRPPSPMRRHRPIPFNVLIGARSVWFNLTRIKFIGKSVRDQHRTRYLPVQKLLTAELPAFLFFRGPSPNGNINSNEQRAKLCRLPPYPKHGGYIVLNETTAAPGAVFSNVSLVQYTTDKHKKVFEIKRFTCSFGQWKNFTVKHSEPKVTKSKHFCRLPPYPNKGTYVVQGRPDARPGDLLQNVSLIQYISDERNEVMTIKHFRCSSGAWYQKVFREAAESQHFHSSWCPNLCSECFGKKLAGCVTDTSTNSFVRRGGRTTAASCALPPRPQFGNYSIISNTEIAQSGDVYDDLGLIYECNADYALVGNKYVHCTKGVWSGALPKCIRFCHLIKQPGVEYACAEAGASADFESCGVYLPEGAVVTPRCRSPYYASRSPLKPMTCEDGKWKNVPECKEVCGLRMQAAEHLGGQARVNVPWHVVIYAKHSVFDIPKCAGSIVARNLVISASRCFLDKESQVRLPMFFFVVAGKFYYAKRQPNDKSQTSEVKDIKMSPWFSRVSITNQHDIALVFLSTPFVYEVQHVWPVCLNFDKDLEKTQLSVGRSGIVSRWSNKQADRTYALQVIELFNVDIQRCVVEGLDLEKRRDRGLIKITSDKICASYDNSTCTHARTRARTRPRTRKRRRTRARQHTQTHTHAHTHCMRILKLQDNGGGFAVAEPDPSDPRKRRYYLRGVVSLYDFLFCFSDFYAVFTKVSAHEDFIKANSAGIIF
ncbi:Modular serine protease [Eumeta japonica]|uniref:Modular serine protease n=1 Tax=Eumeta variegata TaxID=151549 RepID=A0A4C1V4Q6_EUMVA|nr:Modular serine protease [Eumeta japonica]